MFIEGEEPKIWKKTVKTYPIKIKKKEIIILYESW